MHKALLNMIIDLEKHTIHTGTHAEIITQHQLWSAEGAGITITFRLQKSLIYSNDY